jgi:hypothetical protein
MKFKDLLIAGSDANDAGRFDQKKRDAYLNASEAMTCIRKQWYGKNGAQGEAQDWGYARRGTHGEKFIVASLIAANVPLEYTGKDQLSLQDDKRKISATPDGCIKYEDVWIVPEFKTVDPRTNKTNLPKVAHVAQLEIAMELIDQQIDRPDGVTIKGVLIYMDASNYHDITEFDVPRNKAILDQMAKRASKVLRTKDVANLDREGKRNGGKECSTMCSFKRVCGVSEEANAGPKRANRGSNMDAAAIRFMDIKDQVDALSAEQDGLKEDIKNEMKSRNTGKAMVGNIEVSLAIANGRASLNKKAVAAAGIDLSPFETFGAPSERLTVKRA